MAQMAKPPMRLPALAPARVASAPTPAPAAASRSAAGPYDDLPRYMRPTKAVLAAHGPGTNENQAPTAAPAAGKLAVPAAQPQHRIAPTSGGLSFQNPNEPARTAPLARPPSAGAKDPRPTTTTTTAVPTATASAVRELPMHAAIAAATAPRDASTLAAENVQLKDKLAAVQASLHAEQEHHKATLSVVYRELQHAKDALKAEKAASADTLAHSVKATRAALEHTFALQTAALTDRIAALETANRALEAELNAAAGDPPSSGDDDDDAFEARIAAMRAQAASTRIASACAASELEAELTLVRGLLHSGARTAIAVE